MSGLPQNLSLAHAAADAAIAASCLVITAAFLVFALRNRRAHLGRVFAVFAVLFGCGGVMHVCEVGGWPAAGAVFKWLTALSCVGAAVLTVKCLPVARGMFARAAVYERRIDERLKLLREDPRFDNQADREWKVTLAQLKGEMQDLARLAREVPRREEA